MRLAPTLREHYASSYPASASAKTFKVAGKHETLIPSQNALIG